MNGRHAIPFKAGLALLAVCGCSACLSCQKKTGSMTDPSRFRTLVVYDVEGLHGGDISAEELDATPQATLDGETTARIFRQATWKAGEPWWKGGSLGVASLDDGTKRQIAISYYGGIFVVLGEPGYYVIEGESRVAFDVVMKEILAKTFLPSREKGLGRSEFGTK